MAGIRQRDVRKELMKKTVKKLTRAEYDGIKTLIGLNLKNAMVAEISKRSTATISNIKASTDYEHYRDITNAYKAKSLANKMSKPSTDSAPANQQQDSVEKLVNLMTIQAETMEAINDKLTVLQGQVGFIHDHIPTEAKNGRRFW